MQDFIRLCKTCTFRRETESALISSGPALVFSAHLVAGSAGAATAALHDGHTDNGAIKVNLSAPANGADARTFVPPIWFDQAIHLEMGENVTSVFVVMRQTRDLQRPKQKSTLRNWLQRWLGVHTTQEEST